MDWPLTELPLAALYVIASATGGLPTNAECLLFDHEDTKGTKGREGNHGDTEARRRAALAFIWLCNGYFECHVSERGKQRGCDGREAQSALPDEVR